MLPAGYGADMNLLNAYPAIGYGDATGSAKKCARLLKTVEKRQDKAGKAKRAGPKRRRLRRLNRAKSKYVKAGCPDVLPNGHTALSPRAAAKIAADVQAQAQADVAAATAAASGGTTTRTWIIGGVAVLGLLLVVSQVAK